MDERLPDSRLLERSSLERRGRWDRIWWREEAAEESEVWRLRLFLERSRRETLTQVVMAGRRDMMPVLPMSFMLRSRLVRVDRSHNVALVNSLESEMGER